MNTQGGVKHLRRQADTVEEALGKKLIDPSETAHDVNRRRRESVQTIVPPAAGECSMASGPRQSPLCLRPFPKSLQALLDRGESSETEDSEEEFPSKGAPSGSSANPVASEPSRQSSTHVAQRRASCWREIDTHLAQACGSPSTVNALTARRLLRVARLSH